MKHESSNPVSFRFFPEFQFSRNYCLYSLFKIFWVFEICDLFQGTSTSFVLDLSICLGKIPLVSTKHHYGCSCLTFDWTTFWFYPIFLLGYISLLGCKFKMYCWPNYKTLLQTFSYVKTLNAFLYKYGNSQRILC